MAELTSGALAGTVPYRSSHEFVMETADAQAPAFTKHLDTAAILYNDYRKPASLPFSNIMQQSVGIIYIAPCGITDPHVPPSKTLDEILPTILPEHQMPIRRHTRARDALLEGNGLDSDSVELDAEGYPSTRRETWATHPALQRIRLTPRMRERVFRYLDWIEQEPTMAHHIIESSKHGHLLNDAAVAIVQHIAFPEVHSSVYGISGRDAARGGLAGSGSGPEGTHERIMFPNPIAIPETSGLSFFPTPSTLQPWFTMMLSGASNSGKSVFIAQYLEIYVAMYTCDIYFVGFHADDPAYDRIKQHITVVPMTLSMPVSTLTDPSVNQGGKLWDPNDFAPKGKQQSIIVFDDCEIADKEMQKRVHEFMVFCLHQGRKLGISTITAHHVWAGGHETKAARIETTYKVIFLNGPNINMFNTYLRGIGIDNHQRKRVAGMFQDQRFVCIHERTPMCFIAPKLIGFV